MCHVNLEIWYYTETSSNRVFVTVECLYGFKVALADGIKRIVKP